MIFKKYLLFSFLSFIVITSFSQTRSVITGQVVSEDGNAIRNVNVSILKDNVDSAIVALTTTDTLGRFSLKCNGGLKYLRFSCLGYLSKYMLVDTGDIGSVVLVETSLDIEGVVVKGRSKTYRPDGITYLPTDRRVSNSVNGMDLLSSMKPPRIYVDPVSYNISVRGGGDVVLLINDRPATSGEIQSIDPELIRRIDYYDKPTPRFPLASIVINLTVDLPARGGAVNVNITEGISNTYGEHYVIGRVYNGRHSFMVDWQPQFRYSFSQMRERSDYFNFPSETISRNEIAIPARQIYWHNNSSAHYNYTGRKIMLDIAGFGQFDRDKNNDFAGRVITKTSSKSDTTINNEHNFERNTTQGISTYIEVKSPIGPLYINADYSLRSAKYKREFEEFSSINPFFSSNSNSEEIHLTGLQGNYNAPLPLGEMWSGMLSLSSSWRSRWISNSYSSLGVEPVAVNMRQNNGENKIMLMVMGDKLMLALGAVHFWQNYSIDDYTKRWSQWLPIGAISLSPTRTWTVDLDAMLKYSQPPIGELTTSEIRLDPYQVQRGNPNLTNTRLLQFTLNNTLELTSKYELFVQGKYRQIQNPIMDISFLEQQADLSYIVVRMPENLNKFTQYTASCSLEGTEIWNFLSFSLWGGFSRYISDGGSVYEHEAFIPFCQGQFNIKWRKWDFVSEMWYGQTDAQMGEVLKSKSLHSRFIVSSQYGKLRVSVGVMNPFLKVRDVKYENLSAIAPYTRYAYNQMYENLFFAKLTYLFSWGSEQRKRGKPKFKATEQETTIIKGER